MAKYTERVNAFTILVGGKPIILAADDEMALKKWENALAVPMGKAPKESAESKSKAQDKRRKKGKHYYSKTNKGMPSYLFGSQTDYKPSGEGLRDAIKHGDFEACRKILQQKKSLASFIDSSDNSVLHLAVLFNDKKIAQLLVECGASINVENKIKETPLSLAKPVMKKCLSEWADKAKE